MPHILILFIILQIYKNTTNSGMLEVFRVLLENSDIKLNTARTACDVVQEAKQNENSQNKNQITFYLNKELLNKLNKMKLKNNISYFEIVQYLAFNADFSKMELKTKDKTYSASRKTVLKRKAESKDD